MPQIEMHIAKPCNQSWTAMKGDERVRFCGACQKNVYNLTQMSDAEIEELIRQTDGKFCGRLYRRTDNRVMQGDCPKGVAAVRRRIGLAFAATFGAAFAALWPVFARPTYAGAISVRRSVHVEEPVEEPAEPVMGKMKVDPSRFEMGETAVEPHIRRSNVGVIPKRPTILKP